MISPVTFGNTNAGVLLVRRLTEIADPSLTRRVGAFIDHTCVGFREIEAVEDDAVYQQV